MRQDASAILALLLGEMKDRGRRTAWKLLGQLARVLSVATETAGEPLPQQGGGQGHSQKLSSDLHGTHTPVHAHRNYGGADNSLGIRAHEHSKGRVISVLAAS